jgi:hypothetical protein
MIMFATTRIESRFAVWTSIVTGIFSVKISIGNEVLNVLPVELKSHSNKIIRR